MKAGPLFTAGSRRARWLTLLCSIGALGVWVAPAQAITFAQQTVLSGLAPNGIAFDTEGNLYVTNDTTAQQQVIEVSPAGTQTVLGFRGLIRPFGIAVDSFGNVIVADAGADGGAGAVVELPRNGQPQETLLSGGGLIGVAVNAQRDIFAVEDGTGSVVELPEVENATYGSPQTLNFTGLANPLGVALDSTGDVFVADSGNDRVVELTTGGAQLTLPFSGLNSEVGLAVDPAGDVFVGDTDDNRIVELPAGGSQLTLGAVGYPLGVAVDSAGNVFAASGGYGQVDELLPMPAPGSLSLSPGSGPVGTAIGVASVTPCPVGGASPATGATVTLKSPAGASLATTSVGLDAVGDWTATLTVPAEPNGTDFVTAICTEGQFGLDGVAMQYYADAGFVIGATSGGGAGSQGPPGPQGNPGTNGTNGINGTNGAVGPTGAKGDQGATGSSGPAGPSPTGSTTKCTTTIASLTATTTTCTITYTYNANAAADIANGARAEATAKINGSTKIVATGRVRKDKLVLRFKHLKRGRYQLTLLQLRPHDRPQVIGHTSLVIS